jgi:surface antigen
MQPAPLLVLVGALLAIAPTTPSHAQLYGFLKYSPVADLTEADLRLAQEALLEALDTRDDGETLEWVNPETGHAGSVTPLKARVAPPGRDCRDARVVNRTAKGTGETTYRLCRDSEGDWKVE